MKGKIHINNIDPSLVDLLVKEQKTICIEKFGMNYNEEINYISCDVIKKHVKDYDFRKNLCHINFRNEEINIDEAKNALMLLFKRQLEEEKIQEFHIDNVIFEAKLDGAEYMNGKITLTDCRNMIVFPVYWLINYRWSCFIQDMDVNYNDIYHAIVKA